MKRDKTCVSWCGALSAVAMMFAFALSSCTKDPIDGDMQQPDKEVPAGMICIDFSSTDSQLADTRAGELQTTEEKRIDAADIFFYGTTEGGNKGILVKRVSTSDQGVDLADSKILIPNTGLEANEAYKIVVVANGGVGFTTDDLTVGSSIDILTEKFTFITDITSLKTPLLMSGQVDSHIFSNNPTAKIEMVRQVVKLNVTVKLGDILTKTYPDAQFGGITADVGKADLSIWNLPSHSFVMNNVSLPTPSKMLPEVPKEMPWNATAQEWNFTTYAYAHTDYPLGGAVNGTAPAAKDRSTQFTLRLPYRLTSTDQIVANNYYKIYIDDPEDPHKPHKTVRNKIYNVAVTINGFGNDTPDYPGGLDMTVTTNVLPWNVFERFSDISDVLMIGPYYLFMRPGEVSGTQLAEGGNVHDEGGTIEISYRTNVGGFYVIVRNHGKIVQNTKSTPTPVVNGETDQSIKIVVPPIGYLEDGRYTVSIHHPLYASELITPIPPLNFTQYGGFIPNSVLSQSFTSVNAGDIQGWPADRLPARGLQIAKRGIQILPSGVEQEKDPEKQWKTSNTFTSGTTAPGLGMGKSSTDAMIAAGADEHPAAKYCREMGPEWYLPSRDELLLIYNYQAALGTSYTFPANIYRSSTADRSDHDFGSLCVLFGSGTVEYLKKTSTIKVRCVREI